MKSNFFYQYVVMLREVYTMGGLQDSSNSQRCCGMKKNDCIINHVYEIIEFS